MNKHGSVYSTIQYFVYDVVADNRELVSNKEKKKIKKKKGKEERVHVLIFLL